eukprot:TRINITY_DN12812_c0_g1_i1.p1 TRINITY_DN12812_c0_g1~~TRINITY_DN12812_c0_g1_i1.p1  ORF type:complete len:242 (+),score=30.11 TRINITY_DN12812_c0_g1_i1:26-727(+)
MPSDRSEFPSTATSASAPSSNRRAAPPHLVVGWLHHRSLEWWATVPSYVVCEISQYLSVRFTWDAASAGPTVQFEAHPEYGPECAKRSVSDRWDSVATREPLVFPSFFQLRGFGDASLQIALVPRDRIAHLPAQLAEFSSDFKAGLPLVWQIVSGTVFACGECVGSVEARSNRLEDERKAPMTMGLRRAKEGEVQLLINNRVVLVVKVELDAPVYPCVIIGTKNNHLWLINDY